MMSDYGTTSWQEAISSRSAKMVNGSELTITLNSTNSFALIVMSEAIWNSRCIVRKYVEQRALRCAAAVAFGW